jgi:hypothetical protein
VLRFSSPERRAFGTDMTTGEPPSGARQPVEIARTFLDLVTARRWNDAVCLIDQETKERFRAWALRGLAEPPPPQPLVTDTYFPSVEAILGVRDRAEAESLTPDELLVRHAAARARQMERFVAYAEAAAASEFVHLGTRSAGDAADCEFRRAGAMPRHFAPTQRVQLVRRASGWFVRDADLLGYGDGRILPPDHEGWSA